MRARRSASMPFVTSATEAKTALTLAYLPRDANS
jgi:hypothetical protein